MAQRPLAWHEMAPIPLLPAYFPWFYDELKKNTILDFIHLFVIVATTYCIQYRFGFQNLFQIFRTKSGKFLSQFLLTKSGESGTLESDLNEGPLYGLYKIGRTRDTNTYKNKVNE
jgi:hypothetical protein